MKKIKNPSKMSVFIHCLLCRFFGLKVANFLKYSSCLLVGFCLFILICSFNARKKRAVYERKAAHEFFYSKKAPEWMFDQIEKELSGYKETGISLTSLHAAVQEYLISMPHNIGELVYCCIRDKKVSILDIQPTQATHFRWNAIYHALNDLGSIASVPDIDLIICIGDSLPSDVTLLFKKYHVPVLAFAKSKEDTVSVLMPDCEALLNGFYGKILEDTAEGRRKFPWHQKEEKVFWRGATTGVDNEGRNSLNYNNYQDFPRIKLVQLSAKYDSLIDAKLSVLAQITDPELFDLLSPYKGPLASVVDHLKYKYQILIDGNTCAYSRAYWQLFSDCLMFKQASSNIQWYYGCLLPYVHYVPVAYDLSDLLEKIEWARKHDAEAYQIVANANNFAQKNLKKQDVYLYLLLLLERYAELQK